MPRPRYDFQCTIVPDLQRVATSMIAVMSGFYQHGGGVHGTNTVIFYNVTLDEWSVADWCLPSSLSCFNAHWVSDGVVICDSTNNRCDKYVYQLTLSKKENISTPSSGSTLNQIALTRNILDQSTLTQSTLVQSKLYSIRGTWQSLPSLDVHILTTAVAV